MEGREENGRTEEAEGKGGGCDVHGWHSGLGHQEKVTEPPGRINGKLPGLSLLPTQLAQKAVFGSSLHIATNLTTTMSTVVLKTQAGCDPTTLALQSGGSVKMRPFGPLAGCD